MDLLHPIPAPEPLSPEVIRALAAIRRRPALEASGTWRAVAAEVTARTQALSYGRPGTPAPVPPRSFLRVASWNVQRGIRLDGILAILRTHPVLADLDVLLLNEVDLGMARSGNRDVAAAIGEALGFSWVFGNSYVCLDHGDARDRQDGAQGTNTHAMHGNAILSRWPLVRAENVPVHVTKDKFHSSEKRLGAKRALWAEVDTPVGRLAVGSAHLDSVASPGQRAAQLGDLLTAMEATRPLPALVGGDFNTHTYDIRSLPRLVRNLFLKAIRGAFPHTIHHYMHPWDLYERPVFQTLEAAGFLWQPFNDLSRGTMRYEVGQFDSESSLREQMPGVAVDLLRWKLKPWNGVVPMRMDWLAGRGARALSDGDLVDADGRTSRSPTTAPRPRWEGAKLSDHDPIVVDVVPVPA
jgi:endonuclease/exonuclease/phosphatase family metal-dependent hydrolase